MVKQWSVISMIMLVGLAGTTLIGFCLFHHSTIIVNLANFVQENQVVFMLWRYGLFGLLLILWPSLIHWIGHYRQWDTVLIQLLIKKRLSIVVMFILVEFIIVHNSLNQIINFI